MDLKEDIRAILIKLDINNKQSLFILLARDGSVMRMGNGRIDETDIDLNVGNTKEPLFKQLHSLVNTSWIPMFTHTYIIPNNDENQIKGARCRLMIGFQYPDEDKGIDFLYGIESGGVPIEIHEFVQVAINLTDEWAKEAKKRSVPPDKRRWGVTLGVPEMWARGVVGFLSVLFADELARWFSRFRMSAQVNQNKVSFKNMVFGIKAEIENGPTRRADGWVMVGIRVYICINDKAINNLTTGIVGGGRREMEAFKNAVSDWGKLVAQAVVRSCLNGTGLTMSDCYRIGHHRIFPGDTGFRRQINDTQPLEWNWEQHTRILELINSKLPGILPSDDMPHSMMLTFVINQTGAIEDGSVFFDGNKFPKLIEVLRDFPWPITSKGYIFRQFYLIERLIRSQE